LFSKQYFEITGNKILSPLKTFYSKINVWDTEVFIKNNCVYIDSTDKLLKIKENDFCKKYWVIDLVKFILTNKNKDYNWIYLNDFLIKNYINHYLNLSDQKTINKSKYIEYV